MKNNKLNIPSTEEIGINSFNAIRFFCCLIVIIGHCLDISHTKFAYRNFIDMHISVCVFFILSGFWVTKSFFSAENLKSYAIKRIKRLLPMYYLSVFLFAIICSFYSELGVKNYFFNSNFYKYLFWNSIFLNFMCPSLPDVFNSVAINGALWTIKVEIGFYIILPVLIYILRKLDSLKKQNIFLIIIYVLSVIWNIGLNYLSKILPIPSQLSHQLPGFMSYFVMGMIFLFNWQKLISLKNYFIIPSLIIFSLHYVTKTEILMPLSLTMIVMFIGKSFSFLKKIGYPVDYSYGMYLFHFPLINILNYHNYFNNKFLWGGGINNFNFFFYGFCYRKVFSK